MLQRLRLLPISDLIARGFRFLGGEPLTPGTRYRTWESQFMRKRLYLVLLLGIGMFQCLMIPRFVYDTLHQEALPPWWYVDAWVNLGLLCSLGLLKLTNTNQMLNVAFLGFTVSVNIIEQVAEVVMGGVEFNVLDDFFYWVFVFFLQATLIPVRWKLHVWSHLLTYSTYVAIKVGFAIANSHAMIDWYPRDWSTPQSWIFTLAVISFVATLSVYLHERTTRAEFRARLEIYKAYQKLETEQERSEELLRNILPDKIACRLKHESQTIADTFAEVTVLFADIVGFTQLSSHICATELVELLNGIFSRFDRLAERHSLEKIKTIGDAYMVVAGLPEPRPDHTAAIANMALDMQQAIQDFNQETGYKLDIRVGIHSGGVVAGVIGLKKFAYDIWGDTVNIASRMESHGVPGRIQVTAVVYQALRSRYDLELRGEIPVKGKGRMKTYLLNGRQSKFSSMPSEPEIRTI